MDESYELELSDDQNEVVSQLVYNYFKAGWKILHFRVIKFGPYKSDKILIIGFKLIDKRSTKVIDKKWLSINYYGDVSNIQKGER